jgi:hypothetical protein
VTPPAAETLTRLPPPAPTLETSVESALITRSCSSSNVFCTNGRPSTTSDTSVEVPPMSAQIRLLVPIASPRRTLETVPACWRACSIPEWQAKDEALVAAELA